MKKIPYGISNFQDLIKQNYYYVDKTQYIEIIENFDEKYLFFLRPRRFGKSLFISLLDTYYDINMKNKFDEYFNGLYISDNKTPLANSYYILNFNFSGIDTEDKESLLKDFTSKIIEALDNFIDRYQFDVNFKKTGKPAMILNSFLNAIEYNIDKEIYVLIDEYDHFANELLGFKHKTFLDIVSKTGFVRKWYEILKEGTEKGIVDRIFATGVSPITLDSLTSGFNIAKNKTRSKKLNMMMGFTEKEVKEMLTAILPNVDVANIMPALRKYYNGYLFNEQSHQRLFNSDMILFYITEYLENEKVPVNLIDTNISSDYAKISELFRLGQKEINYKIIESILDNELQPVVITREFNLANKFTGDDFKSLLYYLGFLTIAKYDSTYHDIKLGVPNYVIKELYFDFFYEIINDETDYSLDLSEVKGVVKQLAKYGEIESLVNVVENTLEKLSFRDFRQFNEQYVKLIMLTYLTLSKTYYVKSEYEVENGYIDIALLVRSGLQPKYEVLIELKYIKKQDYEKNKEETVEKSLKAGKKQLLKYKNVDEFKDRENLLKIVIIFAGNKCVKLAKIN